MFASPDRCWSSWRIVHPIPPRDDARHVVFERAPESRSVPSSTSLSTIVAVNVLVTLPTRKRRSAVGRRPPLVATYSLPRAETKTIRLLAPKFPCDTCDRRRCARLLASGRRGRGPGGSDEPDRHYESDGAELLDSIHRHFAHLGSVSHAVTTPRCRIDSRASRSLSCIPCCSFTTARQFRSS